MTLLRGQQVHAQFLGLYPVRDLVVLRTDVDAILKNLMLGSLASPAVMKFVKDVRYSVDGACNGLGVNFILCKGALAGHIARRLQQVASVACWQRSRPISPHVGSLPMHALISLTV